MNTAEFEPFEIIPYAMVAGVVLGVLVIYFDLIPERIRYGQMGKKGYMEHCIDGVAYIDNGKMITPKLLVSGQPASCHE